LAADFVGVRVPDRYLIGYGLDYKHYFRNVRGVYAVADQDI
jgi:hypoxanthine phosphoribosyltransferase